MINEIGIITVDGPAASGKSSLSQALAGKLRWKWLSTGVFYRGLAFMALTKKQTDHGAIVHLLKTEAWSVRLHKKHTCFIYEGEDITPEVYTEEVDSLASTLAGVPLIRKVLLPFQRDCLKGCGLGLVAEGRDCGTVVFPTARLKIYLTAPPAVRAKRRAHQRGSLPLGDVMILQNKRDEQDTRRSLSPLCPPEGAFIMDTGALALEEMVQKAYNRLKELGGTKL